MPRVSKKKANQGKTVADHDSINFEDEFLTTREAAALTKMSVAWFERERWARRGPPFLKAGRSVRYLKSDLLAWWSQRRFSSGEK